MSHLNHSKITLCLHSKLLLFGTIMFEFFLMFVVVRLLWRKGIRDDWLGLNSDRLDLLLGVWCVDSVGKRLLGEGSGGEKR